MRDNPVMGDIDPLARDYGDRGDHHPEKGTTRPHPERTHQLLGVMPQHFRRIGQGKSPGQHGDGETAKRGQHLVALQAVAQRHELVRDKGDAALADNLRINVTGQMA